MDVGEAVAVEVAGPEHDESCYFCRAEKEKKDDQQPETNYLTDNDATLENSLCEVEFDNSSKKLGSAVKKSGQKPAKRPVTLDGKTHKVTVSAHHLIPGLESLRESMLFKSGEYLREDGMAEGNVGYNVNSAPNGVWSPGSYGVTWGTNGQDFDGDPQAYAFAAMEAWKTQFHDRHIDYSEFVIQALDKLYEKLEAAGNSDSIWCEHAKARDKESQRVRPPMYPLVARLNTISKRMKRMLTFPTTNWKANVYTSRFALQYMRERQHRQENTVPENYEAQVPRASNK